MSKEELYSILYEYLDLSPKLLNEPAREAYEKLMKYINYLQQENPELKKQLEEKENQQKEFIEWLEKESKELIRDAGYHQRICLDILEKYKEIIGDKE